MLFSKGTHGGKAFHVSGSNIIAFARLFVICFDDALAFPCLRNEHNMFFGGFSACIVHCLQGVGATLPAHGVYRPFRRFIPDASELEGRQSFAFYLTLPATSDTLPLWLLVIPCPLPLSYPTHTK